MKLRRGICYVLVGCSSLIEVAGCIPFLPGAFAMMCLENGKKSWLLLCTIMGLASAVPWIDAIRYGFTVMLLLLGSALLEKICGRKDSLHMAIWTFATVFLVGASGVLMENNRIGLLAVALEGLLGFGIVLTFQRFVHWYLMPKDKIFATRTMPEEERNQRVRQYVSACEKLAGVFAPPRYEYALPRGETSGGIPTSENNVFSQSRMAISQQLLVIAGNIERCTKEEVYLCKEDQQLMRLLEYELKENGINGKEFLIFEDEEHRHRVEFVASTGPGQNLSLRNVGEIVSRIVERPMVPREDMKVFLNRDERKVVFIETGKYQVLSANRKRSGDGERICGDNEFFLTLNEGRKKVLGISDGMGRGPGAAKESELILEVMEELLEAGFSPEQAIPMLNSACALRQEEQGCSTLDLCMIDTFTGLGSWYKMGAAASFLRRGDRVEVLYGNTLPIGAVEQSLVWKQERQLQEGDTLVFMTDGALEILPTEYPEEMMKELILRVQEDTPGNMTNQLLEMLSEIGGRQARDDMLISVLRIWER